LEQYLRCFINYHQDDWVDLLPIAEFAYNNTFQESIHQTPFFANYGHHPRFDSLNLSLAKNPVAQDLVTRLLEIHKDMKARLVEAQERQKRNADKSWKQNPNISVRDKVWLLRRNLKTRCQATNLTIIILDLFTWISRSTRQHTGWTCHHLWKFIQCFMFPCLNRIENRLFQDGC